MSASPATTTLETSAFITTVGEDHTIHLPADVPTGATVAVVVMSANAVAIAEAERRAHLAVALKIVRDAVSHGSAPAERLTDAELNAIINEVRKRRRA